MSKFISNNELDIVKDSLEGMIIAEPNKYERIYNEFSYILRKKRLTKDNVRIIISGGGGYGPLFAGFVHDSLADVVCSGYFNCAPNAYAIYDSAKHVHSGKGIMLITNNFAGDYLNNDMAQELLASDKIESEACYVSDDIFSCKDEESSKRGGLGGIAMIIKIASKAAGEALSLKEVMRISQKANDRIVSTSICFNEADNKIEFGAGFSGEPPFIIIDYISADDIVSHALKFLLDDLEKRRCLSKDLYVTINRLRRMSYVEGYVIVKSVKERLQSLGYNVLGINVGSYFDMYTTNGCIISLLSSDEEIKKYMDSTVSAYDFSI